MVGSGAGDWGCGPEYINYPERGYGFESLFREVEALGGDCHESMNPFSFCKVSATFGSFAVAWGFDEFQDVNGDII